MKAKAGLAWINSADYSELISVSADGNMLPKTHDEWLEDAEETECRAKARGVRVIRILIKPHAFMKWCKTKNLRPDARARRRYARHGALLGHPPTSQ